MTHELKIAPLYFAEWLRGAKTCELRKDDREPKFAAGDELHLMEYATKNGDGWYTGDFARVLVTAVLRDHEGLAPGYCLMSGKRVG